MTQTEKYRSLTPGESRAYLDDLGEQCFHTAQLIIALENNRGRPSDHITDRQLTAAQQLLDARVLAFQVALTALPQVALPQVCELNAGPVELSLHSRQLPAIWPPQTVAAA